MTELLTTGVITLNDKEYILGNLWLGFHVWQRARIEDNTIYIETIANDGRITLIASGTSWTHTER